MRKGLPWVLGILLIGATALFAQAPPSSLQPQPPPAFPVTGVLPELQPPEFGTPSTVIVEAPAPLEYARPFRFWLRAEYLFVQACRKTRHNSHRVRSCRRRGLNYGRAPIIPGLSTPCAGSNHGTALMT